MVVVEKELLVEFNSLKEEKRELYGRKPRLIIDHQKAGCN